MSVYNFGTCVSRTGAQWQNPGGKTYFDEEKIGFCHCAAVLQAKVSKFSHPQILVSSTF